VIITSNTLFGEMAQLFSTSYVSAGVIHSADVGKLSLEPSNVSVITFGTAGLPNDPAANFVVADTWDARIVNFLNTDDVIFNGTYLAGHERAGQDVLFDLTTVPAMSTVPGPNLEPFRSDFVSLGTMEHHPVNYGVAIDVITSSPGFAWMNTNSIALVAIGDNHDNASVSTTQGTADQARFALGLAGNDVLAGFDGHDVLDGGAGTDTLRGYAGDDRFYGGAGNDVIAGGSGTDTAHFEGLSADYSISSFWADGILTTTVIGPSDTDTITGVEFLQFADAVVAIESGPDELAPGPGDSFFDTVMSMLIDVLGIAPEPTG
jgi:Ca2+-binding RTX toxin-like protein